MTGTNAGYRLAEARLTTRRSTPVRGFDEEIPQVLRRLCGPAGDPVPLLAHHGRGATYDMKQQVSLKGVVAEVLWRNPHIAIVLDAIELRLTLTDPAYYRTPRVSDTKIFKREPRANVTFFGCYGLFSGLGELICAPMNASPVNKKGG